MTTPNRHIPYVPEDTLDPAAGLNLALNIVDALLQTSVLSMALTAPPGSPADGDLYIPASPATGDWSGFEDYVVRYVAEGDFWQEFEPGVQVNIVLNIDDGGLYKFIPGSPGGWVLAAGLSDAPVDGQQYVRRDADWEQLSALQFLSTESPPDVGAVNVTTVLIDQERLELVEISPGVVMLSARQQTVAPPPVVTEAGTALTALPAASGNYTRFTNAAAKAYTFDGAEAYVTGDEYHGRNTGVGDLTITAAGGMTLNAPAGGTLIIPQGGTFTVKIVASAEADVFGVTT